MEKPPGYKSVMYFVNWAIYGRDHHPQSLPASRLTHILYAFADLDPTTGTAHLTDAWADTDKHYTGDSWSEPGTNLYGCLKQLSLLKKRNRGVKTLLSIGGWTYSGHFPSVAASATLRQTFATSAVRLLADLGFDGLDIDWEYPATAADGADFVLLLRATREALDAYADRSGTPRAKMLLSACFSANAEKRNVLPVAEVAELLDLAFLMAYDYAGSWDRVVGHQANVWPSRRNPARTPFATSEAVDGYEAMGMPVGKVVMGMPLYGRAFGNTEGMGQPFEGTGPRGEGKGSWEQGVWEYKALPREGEVELWDDEAGASWCEGPDGLVSYDNVRAARMKAEWIIERGLGGAGWWESSGDEAVEGVNSLVRTVTDVLGKLEDSENNICYPDSKYDNMRAGFPAG